MTNWEIENQQRQITETLKTVHPDNEFAVICRMRYRELENRKNEQSKN